MLAMQQEPNKQLERANKATIFLARPKKESKINKEIVKLIEKRMDELYLLDNSVIIIGAFVRENHTQLAQAVKLIQGQKGDKHVD